MWFFLLPPILIICIGVPIVILFNRRSARFREDYRQSLRALTKNPDDITLRQQALFLGRRYYQTLVGFKSDPEMAVQNDISQSVGK